ncbi:MULTISPECIES: transposase [Halomonadaceae]|uniref:transposase n=1 Tax=Halomonadaceae TaxID=28256 RepID=UPI00159A1F95|nr:MULTISPECIES: transposase [Halomonas]QJQ95533.1 transposase [Halomonas sp. PA5]
MEAYASSHYWARALQACGYHVKLIAAQFVKPYVKSNKNDRVDAEAICEAMSRLTMRFVTVKTALNKMFRPRTASAKSWFSSAQPRPTRSVA